MGGRSTRISTDGAGQTAQSGRWHARRRTRQHTRWRVCWHTYAGACTGRARRRPQRRLMAAHPWRARRLLAATLDGRAGRDCTAAAATALDDGAGAYGTRSSTGGAGDTARACAMA
eukprot:4271376-Pleurochrysis_carterae.AAC.1